MCNCHISRSGSLETLNTADTDANMSGLDHRHVIGTITNSQKQRLQVSLDKLDDQGFLKRGDTTIGGSVSNV